MNMNYSTPQQRVTRFALAVGLTVVGLLPAAAVGVPATELPPKYAAIQRVSEPFHGVTRLRLVQRDDDPAVLPRPLVVNLIAIDPNAEGVAFTTTRDNGDLPGQFTLQTVSAWAGQTDVAVAINAAFFTYQKSNGATYADKGADAIGLTIREGEMIAPPHHKLDDTLVLTDQGAFAVLETTLAPQGAALAISGNQRLLRDGEVATPDNAFSNTPNPRTAIGVDADGMLWIAVVDGRQPGYAEGMTTPELAELMQGYGVTDAINLDGGGSSTLVIERDGQPKLVNSPSDGATPARAGVERAVANHFGVFATPRPGASPLAPVERPEPPAPPQAPETQGALEGVVFAEPKHGDLSNDNAAPTKLTLRRGGNTIVGRIGGGDASDVFGFELEDDSQLTAVVLRRYAAGTTLDASVLQASRGPTFPANGKPDLGQSRLAADSIDDNVIPAEVEFTGPGVYTMRVIEYGPAAEYRLELFVE